MYDCLFLCSIRNADTDMSNNDQDYLATDVRSIAYYDAFISASGGDPLVAHEANSRLNRFTNLTHIPTDDELDDLGPLSPVEIIVSCSITLFHISQAHCVMVCIE